MRIRKHAKISPLLYTTSYLKPGTVLQTHVCQLNQSPWDAMNFSPPPPPPPPQVDGDCACTHQNGSSKRRISLGKREDNNNINNIEYSGDVKTESPPAGDDVILCCKTDGKSWQCRREAIKGNVLCERHLSVSSAKSSHHVAKKGRPARPKKASSTSNPYEFYYYSGFGPRWGKKRGENGSSKNGRGDDDEIRREMVMASQIGEDESSDDEYDDDDDDEEGEENNRDSSNGKKRVRKPIKARSLKSLM